MVLSLEYAAWTPHVVPYTAKVELGWLFRLLALSCRPTARCVTLAPETEPFSAMNEGQIRRKVFLRLLGHPVVIAPLVLGVSTAIAVWTFNWPPGLGWFAAAAGVLASVGVYLTRVILDDGKTARSVIADCEQRDQLSAQAALDDLDRRLVAADNDPRPETALRDLRALVHAMDDYAGGADGLEAPVVVDVRSRVQQIFDSSVRSLEQTLQLGDTAKALNLPEARKPLLEQRERIIADIQAGVKQLAGTLAALQRIGAGAQSTRELSRLRDELDQSLAIATRVEERLNSLLDRTESDIRSLTPRESVANQPKGN